LSTDPNYAVMRKTPTAAEVQHQLTPDTALVEYVIAEDSLEIFCVTTNELRARSVPIRAVDLQNKVEFLRDVLQRKDTDEWRLPAWSVYRSVTARIADEGWLRGIRNIYIAPHSILHYLPFAVPAKSVTPSPIGRGRGEGLTTAKLTPPSSRNGSRNTEPIRRGPLLIDDYVIAYLPAAAALVYGGSGSAARTSMLAMAPASTRLRYAQQESEDVSAFYPGGHLLLLGSRATESSFKRLADRYDVIHLATHGYFNK